MALIVLGFIPWNYRPIAVTAVPYIIVNIYNYSGLVVTVTNNPIGLIFSRVGLRDLDIYFSNKTGL